jgi:hypothetical protein
LIELYRFTGTLVEDPKIKDQKQDFQNNIKCHNFSYILPRILVEKFNLDPASNHKSTPKKSGKKRDQKYNSNKESDKEKQRIKDTHK